MRHRLNGRHLGRATDHRVAMYRNLVTDLCRYERITTTEAKAKEIRPMAEKMVTLSRRGDLHARRQALRFIYDEKVVKHLFDTIAPRMKDRPGGYLRITKLEPRKGDGASMATIEFVDYGGTVVSMPRPSRVTSAPSTARFTAAVAAVAAPAAIDDDPVAEEVAVGDATEASVAEEAAVGDATEASVAEEASAVDATEASVVEEVAVGDATEASVVDAAEAASEAIEAPGAEVQAEAAPAAEAVTEASPSDSADVEKEEGAN